MSAQESLAAIANLGTTNIRVHATVTALNAWSVTEMRDTFRHYLVHVSITKVGVGPLESVQQTGKNLDVACDKALDCAAAIVNAASQPKRKTIRLKKKV